MTRRALAAEIIQTTHEQDWRNSHYSIVVGQKINSSTHSQGSWTLGAGEIRQLPLVRRKTIALASSRDMKPLMLFAKPKVL
jgi:hypothetical protein